MKYRVELESRARREYLRLQGEIKAQITEAIDSFQVDPRPPGSRKLIGGKGYRVRKGDYRILYTIDDRSRLVRVYRVGHRRDIYRGL